jgi:hopanoid biosynthesis associated protein HpnK
MVGNVEESVVQDRYLVINADDFGLSSEVNEGILMAHKQGYLTSASLMANGPMLQDAVDRSYSVPSLGIGVHLNLVRGRPISQAQVVDRLVDRRGLFPGTVGGTMRRLMLAPVAVDQAECECLAQIEYIKQIGICPTHVDSEKHVHMYPPLFKRVARVARAQGIRWIRIVRENRIPWHTKPRLRQMGKATVLGVLARRCQKTAAAVGLLSSDGFYGVVHAGRMVKDVYIDIFNSMQSGVTEIICHPGLPAKSHVNRDMGPYFLAETRRDELDALLDATLRDELQKRRIKLVHFGDIQQ